MHYFEIKNQKNDLMIENKNYELIYSEREKFEGSEIRAGIDIPALRVLPSQKKE